MKTKQAAFVAEYVVDFNGAQAAIRAGYSANGAGSAAARLMRRPEVKAALDRALEERTHRTLVTGDRVVREYARIAFADIRKFSEWGPTGVTLRPHTALSDDDAAAIAEVSRLNSKSGARLKLHDKRPALDALGRHVGIFTGRDRPLAKDLRTAAQDRARAALRERIEKLVKEREREAEEAEKTVTTEQGEQAEK